MGVITNIFKIIFFGSSVYTLYLTSFIYLCGMIIGRIYLVAHGIRIGQRIQFAEQFIP